MYFSYFLLKMGDIPASYLVLPEWQNLKIKGSPAIFVKHGGMPTSWVSPFIGLFESRVHFLQGDCGAAPRRVD